MPRGIRITPEQEARINELHEKGVFDSVIAREIGVSKDIIPKHIKRKKN